MVDALSRGPRDAFVAPQQAFRIPDWMFASLKNAMPILDDTESAELLIRSADRHLFCLMRSDLMIVDLSTPSFGDQGHDTLFGFLGGLPIIGLTDRYQNAPSLVSRIDCLIAPTSVGQIVRAIMQFSPVAATESNEPTQPATPYAGPEINQEFAADVLRTAGVVSENADVKGPQV